MNSDNVIELMIEKQQTLSPARFRAYKSKWLVQLAYQIANGDESVDTLALIENIRDSFLGEL